MHGNTAHIICFQLCPCFRPSCPSQTTRIIGSFPHNQLSTMHVMTSARSYNFYHFGDKGADHCGEGDNRNLAGDKVPLETIEGATCGKLYLRDDLCLFECILLS